MDLSLNYLHNADGTYDLYLSITYTAPFYALLIHGADRQEMHFDGVYSMYGYVKLNEGDTWEFHIPLLASGEYIKTVYTAASGAVTAVEHGTTTTIVECTP